MSYASPVIHRKCVDQGQEQYLCVVAGYVTGAGAKAVGITSALSLTSVAVGGVGSHTADWAVHLHKRQVLLCLRLTLLRLEAAVFVCFAGCILCEVPLTAQQL
jgi:hypothetical protein